MVKARPSHTLSKLKVRRPEEFGMGPGTQIDDPGAQIDQLLLKLLTKKIFLKIDIWGALAPHISNIYRYIYCSVV